MLYIHIFHKGLKQLLSPHKFPDIDETVEFLSSRGKTKARKSLVQKAKVTGKVYGWGLQYSELGNHPDDIREMKFASYVDGSLERKFHNVRSIIKFLRESGIKYATQTDIYKSVQKTCDVFGRRWVFDVSCNFPKNIPKYAVYMNGLLQKKIDTEEEALDWLKRHKLPMKNFSLVSAIGKRANKRNVLWLYNKDGIFPSDINQEEESI